MTTFTLYRVTRPDSKFATYEYTINDLVGNYDNPSLLGLLHTLSTNGNYIYHALCTPSEYYHDKCILEKLAEVQLQIFNVDELREKLQHQLPEYFI